MEEKKSQKTEGGDFSIDTDNLNVEPQEVKVQMKGTRKVRKEFTDDEQQEEAPLVSCLRNERVIVRHINRAGTITDPRHVCFGRMHENSKKTFTVPMLSSGTYVNVLTNSEKAFLESILGLEKNALSVYRKQDNFWDDSGDNALATVTLSKQDNILDLSSPEDFIRYKILLANRNLIAPSYQEYMDHPKASYLYYITSETEESHKAISAVGNKSQAYIELGKISEDLPKMRMLLETLVGRPTAPSSKKEFLQVELSKCIEGNAKEFLRVLSDPLLDTKAFIKQCLEVGLLSKKGDWYYMRSDGSPLCEMGEDPTLNISAKFLNSPKHQELLFSLQARLKQ